MRILIREFLGLLLIYSCHNAKQGLSTGWVASGGRLHRTNSAAAAAASTAPESSPESSPAQKSVAATNRRTRVPVGDYVLLCIGDYAIFARAHAYTPANTSTRTHIHGDHSRTSTHSHAHMYEDERTPTHPHTHTYTPTLSHTHTMTHTYRSCL
jgi:hypothetical protein